MTGEERLAILADYLETVPPEQFSLDAWDCGTAACAVGHGARCPILAAEGLAMQEGASGYRWPSYGSLRFWSAVEEFFEMPARHSEQLFLSCYYQTPTTPHDVAQRIRQYLANSAT